MAWGAVAVSGGVSYFFHWSWRAGLRAVIVLEGTVSRYRLDDRLRRTKVFMLLVASLVVLLLAPAGVRAQEPGAGNPLLREEVTAGEGAEKGADLSLTAGEAPLLVPQSPERAVPDQYIVVFKAGTSRPRLLAGAVVGAQRGTLLAVYENALQGFAARLSPEAVKALQAHPSVAFIEVDQYVSLADTQPNATWGLDRIDQRDRPLSGTYEYNRTGSGVNAYVIDTGIRRTHTDFGGRVMTGFDAVTPGGTANDCNGHGTHVAGTVGGTLYGVAKAVRLYPVRVLNCQGSGTNAQVISGIDWVTANHIKPAVANMSLGGSASNAIDTAVRNSISAGVTYVVAAGNSNRNACNYSPARVPEAITVGATTSSDARSSFSNFGSCLDIFAPGSDIMSAWHTSNTATNTISGTSMASPHVAGVAALYLQGNPTAAPSAVTSAITAGASINKLSGIGTGSPNLLLYSLIGGVEPPPPTDAIRNGGFEMGAVDWAQSSSGGYPVITTNRPYAGSWSAWLAGYNNGTDFIAQTVTIPANGRLSYWWRVESREGGGTTIYDFIDVRLYEPSNGTWTRLRRWSNASPRNAWTQDTIDLSAYAGRTMELRFIARTDSSLPTSFFIDEVSLR
jgi:subtilisin family serine protease